MVRTDRTRRTFLKAALAGLVALGAAWSALPTGAAAGVHDGSADKPLRVMLIPADGGTEDGTKADFVPIFNAMSKQSGLKFDIKVGQSYGAVVEAMSNDVADVAFFGAVSYMQAKKRGGAELLAVAVSKGQSIYYSGIFVPADSRAQSLTDLKGMTVAFGDVSSTSSFNYPMAMLIAAGLDPVKDLGGIVLAGSHANSLKALGEGQVEACAASFDSFEKAVKQGAVDATKIRVLAKSEPIPHPPLAMNPRLAPEVKAKLRESLATVHKAEGVTPDMVRGYGGGKVDRYDTTFPESEFLLTASKLAAVTDELKAEVLQKASEAKSSAK